jgi:enterochelin esterase-like enzyme
MKRLHDFLTSNFLLLSLMMMLTACSVSPQRTTSVKPSSLPTTTELAGKYSLFAGSEVSFDVSEQNGNLLVSMFGVKSKLQKITPIRYRFDDGNELKFDYNREGIYDRFATVNEGRPRWFIREDSLQRNRASVTNQAVYTQRLAKNLKPGDYTFSRFISPSRGLVDYSVYLPPEWKRNSNKTYPLVFFLHGQLGWEHSFPDSVPASQLNQWIAQGSIPPMVIVSLRTGRLNGRVEEQWSSARNETLLTSENSNELRQYIRQQFRAGMSARTTAIHGHSRGSRGAIHYALKYPTSFSSAVANAFVSDYALDETKRIAQQNQQQIRSRGIPLRISIGDKDEFALNMGRKASPVIHQYLNNLNILHDYEVFPGVDHGFVNIWNTRQRTGLPNGLGELQLHAEAWAKG